MTDLPGFRHALRTPLNHIISYSEMLIEDATKSRNEGALAELQGIHAAGHELLRLVQLRLNRESFEEWERKALQRGAAVPILRVLDHTKALLNMVGTSNLDVQRISNAALLIREYMDSESFPAAAERTPAQKVATAAPGRLLVVDDDETNRDILRRQLERQEYTVESAGGGREALQMLRDSRFDLVLLDIVMPDMDGFETLAAIKAEKQFRDVAVIVISAMDEMESVSRCIEMGADDYISKPFDRVILQARINAVSKRRNAERESSKLAERLRLLLESTAEGIFGLDEACNCTFINKAALKMLGFPKEALLGKPIHELVQSRRADGSVYPMVLRPMVRAARNGDESRVADDVFWRGNGTSLAVEYTSSPIVREGQIEGAVITFFDISERKRTEQKLQETAKLESLGVLAGGIAHDFNNLLTGILGNASLVMDSENLLPDDRCRLEDVVKSSISAADLTRQMLAYAGKGRYELRTLDLSKLVNENKALLKTLLPGTVRIEEEKPEKIAAIEADPSQIQQVIMNLAINAGEAIGEPHSGLVKLKTFEATVTQTQLREWRHDELTAGKYVVLEVSDTGIGMTPELQAKIFDPFFTTKFTGRGLGLAAVLGIVKSHKGVLQLDSAPGKGSRFRVYFPASDQAAVERASKKPQTTGPVNATILVIDDEEIIRNTTRAVLEKRGFKTLLAENGPDGIGILSKKLNEISLVLLDMMMPGMSGEQAFRHLRAVQPRIPIIVSSGYSETQVMQYFTGRDVSAFIQKPYTAGRLIEMVGNVLCGKAADQHDG